MGCMTQSAAYFFPPLPVLRGRVGVGVERRLASETPTLTLPRSTRGGEKEGLQNVSRTPLNYLPAMPGVSCAAIRHRLRTLRKFPAWMTYRPLRWRSPRTRRNALFATDGNQMHTDKSKEESHAEAP